MSKPRHIGRHMSPLIREIIVGFIGCAAIVAAFFITLYIIFGFGGFQ